MSTAMAVEHVRAQRHPDARITRPCFVDREVPRGCSAFQRIQLQRDPMGDGVGHRAPNQSAGRYILSPVERAMFDSTIDTRPNPKRAAHCTGPSGWLAPYTRA